MLALAHLFAGFWLIKALLLGRRKQQQNKSSKLYKDESLAAEAGHDGSADIWVSMSSQVGVTAQESLQGASTASWSIHTIKELAWKRVGCSYRPHGTNKVVLQDAWGTALSGEVQVSLSCSVPIHSNLNESK